MNENDNISQQLEEMNINELKRNCPEKKFYQVATSIGKLTFEITKFTNYIIIVISYSSVLKLDGYLQVAYPTPYNNMPSVLNLEKDQGQMDNQKLIQLLSKQTKCPIFLSYNIEQPAKGSQQELFHILKNILDIAK